MRHFINLTPHTINILGEKNEEILAVDPAGPVARIRTSRELKTSIGNVPVYETRTGALYVEDAHGDTVGLGLYHYDALDDGVRVIVSSMVAGPLAGWAERHDVDIEVYSPGELVRDDDGRPVGCRGLDRH